MRFGFAVRLQGKSTTHLMLSQRPRKGADEEGSSLGDVGDLAQVKEHGRLSREEVYPEVKDRDVVGLDELAVGLVGCR